MTSKVSLAEEEDTKEEESLAGMKRSDLPEPSCVSIKSDWSMEHPHNFNQRDSSAKLIFQKKISERHQAFSEREVEDEEDQSVKEEVMTPNILGNMKHTDVANTLQTISEKQHILKFKLKEKCKRVNEGISQHGDSVLLNEIYTELYITEKGSGEVSNEHEVRQVETMSRRPTTCETSITCNDIFKAKDTKTVLTKGVAGIGKTVSVQKFILNWADGKTNQDVAFIFPLPFRELNLMKEKNLSLMELLHDFFPEIEELRSVDCDDHKVIFIFDGLDECRLPLDFHNNEGLWDVSESASVDVLLTNLIKRNLFPSALLWITTRPAAASLIPAECVDQVTEVRGFSDSQKEEYFRKRVRDQSLANRIITHLKSSRSLYIMCHIPVFCWIAATVLERMLGEAERREIPKTLTQMFTHFLIYQIKHKGQKYHGNCDTDPHQTRESVLALGKLAFQHLEKGNLIFYEEDLRECGIDVTEVSVYSGVCTQIFREEFGLHLGKVFSFVHLSVQEFLAALYTLITSNKRKRKGQTTDFDDLYKSPVSDFLKSEVDKTLQSKNGHLDLYLRFLMGLSLESNQALINGLLLQTETSSYSKAETVEYIKRKIRENQSLEKSINLFYCLNELNDHSLVQEVQTYLNRGQFYRLSGHGLSAAQWSALVFVLLNSEEDLDVFDLNKFDPSEECFMRLLPVVKASSKAVLSKCNITDEGCAALASALTSNPSPHMRELHLNHNNLGDSGVKQLSALLKNPHCTLEILQLCDCIITDEGCAVLASALISNNSSQLRELHLTYNNIGDSGVKQLSALLENPHCTLETLQLSDCSITGEGCAALASALISNPSSRLRELHLNNNNPGDSGVKLLSALLKNSHCTLKALQLCNCSITDEGCAALASALISKPSSHLRELHLSINNPGGSGVKQLSALLQNPHCSLEILRLCNCSIKAEGFAALASALKSNPSSHLRELLLNHNNPESSGVKQLCALLEDPHCTLEKLELCSCGVTTEGFAALASALISNPSSHLRELHLNHNKAGDSGVKQLCVLLQNPHCTLETLQIRWCNLTGESCPLLASAFRNSSSLKDLDLSDNKLQDTGVKLLSTGLEDPQCKLGTLRLRGCNLTDESCSVLDSVLSSSASNLRHLDLSCNKLQDSGVKLLSTGLMNPQCKLEILRLCKCSIKGEGCVALASALSSNPSSHLRELHLNSNSPGDSGVKQLSALLENPHCRLEILQLW